MSVKSIKINSLDSMVTLRYILPNGRYAIVFKDEIENIYHIQYGNEGFPVDVKTQYETLETIEFQMRQFEHDLRKWHYQIWD